VLTTRVKEPKDSNWQKLLHMMQFINETVDEKLILKANCLNILKWYVDVSYAIHPDYKSHTSLGLTLGTGFLIIGSKKQKINNMSSTTGKLIDAHDASTMILWTKLFMKAQG